MPGLDPAIIEHHIDTWPDVTPVRQKQRLLSLEQADEDRHATLQNIKAAKNHTPTHC